MTGSRPSTGTPDGTDPPTRPVLPPWGITGTPASAQALITAATPGYDANARITTVLYLTVLSGFYAIQY